MKKETETMAKAEVMKVLICDLGAVLVDYTPQQLNEAFLERCAVGADKIEEFFSSEEFFVYERGKISSVDFFAAVQKMLGYTGDYEDFKKVFCSTFRIKEDVCDLLFHEVKPKNNLELWMLSNLNELHYEYILSCWPGIFSNFRRVFLSFKMGFRKPESDIYLEMLKEGGVPSELCLFVDDLKVNCDAAKGAKIPSIQFKSALDLMEKLKIFGIDV